MGSFAAFFVCGRGKPDNLIFHLERAKKLCPPTSPMPLGFLQCTKVYILSSPFISLSFPAGCEQELLRARE